MRRRSLPFYAPPLNRVEVVTHSAEDKRFFLVEHLLNVGSKDWYIGYRITGRRFKRRIGPNKKLAEQVLMDIEVKKAKGDYLGIHEVKKVLFSDCLDEYLEWAQANKAPNTYAMNRFYADRLKEAFTGYVSALTAKQVENYKVKRRATVAPATVNRELALLKHLCTKAVEWGYLNRHSASPRSFSCIFNANIA